MAVCICRVQRLCVRAEQSKHSPVDKPSPLVPQSRRSAILGTTALITASGAGLFTSSLTATAASWLFPNPALAQTNTSTFDDFQGLEEASSSSSQDLDLDTTVTDKVFFDIGLCPEAVRANRTLGDKSILCSDPEPLGRIVISLYGNLVPTTVSNFKKVVQFGGYNGTTFSKVLPGQYLVAGRQGSKRSGLVTPPPDLASNPDTLSFKAFKLKHQRPGTVSLNLSKNEDDDYIKYGADYRNTGILITTGPGPVPSLDGENIVFGQITEGLDVVAAITTVPIFYPNENLRNFNALGKLIGDERASKTQAKWGQPLKAVVIVNSGVLPV